MAASSFSRRLFSTSPSSNSTSRIASGSPCTKAFSVGRNIAISLGELEHGAVDQLDRDRLELDQMLRGVHRLVERAEVAGADRALAQQRRELQLDAGGERERAFRAEQDVREIVLRRVRREGIEIVAADAALHLREVHLDLVGLAQADVEQRVARAGAAASRPAGSKARPSPGRNAPWCRRRAPRRSSARCRASCRSAASARRRNCSPSCRRWWRARRSRRRPGTRGRRA